MRFTVHRPPSGEVSLCWHRPSGGDVACRVHIGITRPRPARDAREDRLALAVLGRDMPAGTAPLRRVRGWDDFHAPRSLKVEPGNQPTPPLTPNRAVETPLLRHPNAWMCNRAAGRAGHRPHVQILHPNGVESAGQIGRGFFHPVASAICFASFKSGNRQLGAASTARAALGTRKALLQPAQPDPFTGCQARHVQQLPGGQCHRYHYPTVNADHTAIGWACDRLGNVRERNVPAPGAVKRDAVRLRMRGHGLGPAEANPSDLRHPHPPTSSVELFDMLRLNADLAEAFMYAGLTPRWTTMGAVEEVAHGSGEVSKRLLLHGLRACSEPVSFSANLRQLGGLLVVPRGLATRLPQLLLLHRQIPNKPSVSAMLQQHLMLSRCRQQPEPRHVRKVTMITDTSGSRVQAYVGMGVLSLHKGRRFPPKKVR